MADEDGRVPTAMAAAGVDATGDNTGDGNESAGTSHTSSSTASTALDSVVEAQADAPAARTKAEDDDGTPVLESVAEALEA